MNRQQRRASQRASVKAGLPMGTEWTPLLRVDAPHLVGDMDVVAKRLGVDVGVVREVAEDTYGEAELYANGIYEVQKLAAIAPPSWVHLIIRKRAGGKDVPWAHKQMIKDQLVGPECEAVEIFPAASRLLDIDDAYHLWCNPEPNERLPIGFDGGRVT